MPEIEIVTASELNNANAAFGADTIYINDEFLSDNSDNPDAVEWVLLEEIGHFVERELSDEDSSGDEGDIFAQLVRDRTIREAELDELQTEDDSTTIGINGEEIDVELAEPPYQEYILHTGTPIGVNPATTEFLTGDYDGDGRSDLFHIITEDTETNSTEVHVLSSASNY